MSFIKFNLKKYVIENDGHIQVIFILYNFISNKVLEMIKIIFRNGNIENLPFL